MTTAPKALDFQVTLQHVEPPIWRRIRLPAAASMWDLHVAIQDAMGWFDCHLHQFIVGDPRDGHFIGIPTDMDPDEIEPGWEVPMQEIFTEVGSKVVYEYDFGDGWTHVVELVDQVTTGRAIRKPRCLAGERACPPEDCGGPYGYPDLLAALRDPSHPEHEAMVEWAPAGFDPEHFDAKVVKFDDPAARLRRMVR